VGKGGEGAEPFISLEQMLDLTAKAEVDGRRFDGVDLFLFEPHVSIDADGGQLRALAQQVATRELVIGSVVAPVWPPTGGGSAMGDESDRSRFLQQVRKACQIGRSLRELGVRPYGVVRIDSACSPQDWIQNAIANQQLIVDTFQRACSIAETYDEVLAAEGEICWGGMHSWRTMLQLLQQVNRPNRLGFQADMAHTLMYLLGYNAPDDAILPQDFDWSNVAQKEQALIQLTGVLRPWTVDLHIAQNDATVFGSGSHGKTGRHCLPNDPQGKLDIPRDAGFWLRDEAGERTRRLQHICWDGCMFPNSVMLQQQTWNQVLKTLLAVQDMQGWD
jgi:hypothetical protein